MRDIFTIIGEIIFLIFAIPLVLIFALLLGIAYFGYVIYELIKTLIFDK